MIDVQALREFAESFPDSDYSREVMAACDHIDALTAAIASLHDKIKHGDDNHQNWLKHEIDEHFRKALGGGGNV